MPPLSPLLLNVFVVVLLGLSRKYIERSGFGDSGSRDAYHAKSDGADHEVCELLLVVHGDADPAVDLLPVLSRRPILDAHDLCRRERLIAFNERIQEMFPGARHWILPMQWFYTFDIF